MTTADFCNKNFNKNRDASDFALSWLNCFFANQDVSKTMVAQSLIFSDFGSNEFYLKHKAMLYPICAHALQSYAEGYSLIAAKNTNNAGIMALMQGIEPVIAAGRLTGLDTVSMRETLVEHLQTMGV
jgi:hypothetical protein